MINIDKISVNYLNTNHNQILWEYEPTGEDLSGYNISILKGLYPLSSSGMELVASGINANITSYNDYDLRQWDFNEHTIYYYLQVYQGYELVSENGPAYSYEVADLSAKEVLRRKSIVLQNPRYNAKTFYILKKTVWNSHCPRCFDPATQSARDANCHVCKGTGRSQGYYDPISMKGWRNDKPNFYQVNQLGSFDESSVLFNFLGFPKIDAGDIIVDPLNNRYLVQSPVRHVEKGLYVIEQIVRAKTLINKNDGAYDVNIDFDSPSTIFAVDSTYKKVNIGKIKKLNDLIDVQIPSGTLDDGDSIMWSGGQWIKTAPEYVRSLNDLDDISAIDALEGQVLTKSADAWIAGDITIPASGLEILSVSHDAGIIEANVGVVVSGLEVGFNFYGDFVEGSANNKISITGEGDFPLSDLEVNNKSKSLTGLNIIDTVYISVSLEGDVVKSKSTNLNFFEAHYYGNSNLTSVNETYIKSNFNKDVGDVTPIATTTSSGNYSYLVIPGSWALSEVYIEDNSINQINAFTESVIAINGSGYKLYRSNNIIYGNLSIEFICQ
jgi:hypothetical protein